MSRIAMLLSNPFRPDPRVYKEAHSLVEMGHQVTIFGWDRAAELAAQETPEPGIQVIRIQNVASSYGLGAGQLMRLPRFWLALMPYLDRFKPDLLHCHDFDTLPAGLWWGKRQHIPVIYDAHEYYADLCKPRLPGFGGNLLYRMIRFAEHQGARLANAVVTVDETLGNIFRRYNSKVVIIGHYPSRALAAVPAPILTNPHLTLLYLGRLSVDRGLLVYVDILRALHQKGIPARLQLVGVFIPAEDEDRLHSYAGSLEEFIDVVPWIHYSQIPQVLRSADVGLAVLLPEPRYVAALPVKLFEYMAAGLPVIASRFPPIEAIVEPAQCGILVDPLRSMAHVVDQICDWWEHPEVARQAGENGRQAILQQYNWETLMSQLDSLYISLQMDPDSLKVT